jgi:hypothetical protein
MTIRGTEDRSFRKSLDTFTVLGPWVVTEGRHKGRKPTARARSGEVISLRTQGMSMNAIAVHVGTNTKWR